MVRSIAPQASGPGTEQGEGFYRPAPEGDDTYSIHGDTNTPMTRNLSLQSLPRVKTLPREDFERLYLKPLRPVIITDLASAWPALRKWTPEFFKTAHGHKLVRVYDASFAQAGQSYMSNAKVLSLKDYIDLVMTTSQDLRMFLYNIKREIPELAGDVHIPSIADGFSHNFIFMFFGCKGSVTQMHFDIDMAHVFHTAIHGKKTITLFPYEEARNSHRHPFTCRTYVDVHNPDLERFPRLREAKGYEGVLEPGETLFMPGGYWHHIVYDEPGYAISLRCSHQSRLARLHGYYNLLLMSPIDRLMNKVSPRWWFRWKKARAHCVT